MKKIIAIILTIVTVMTLASCGKKNTNQTPKTSTNTYEDKVIETPKTSVIREVDKRVKEYLGDDVFKTDYDDGIYYICIAVENVNSSRLVTSYGLGDSIDGLSETINTNFDVDCAILIMDDATHSNLLYASFNGYDVTDQLN